MSGMVFGIVGAGLIVLGLLRALWLIEQREQAARRERRIAFSPCVVYDLDSHRSRRCSERRRVPSSLPLVDGYEDGCEPPKVRVERVKHEPTTGWWSGAWQRVFSFDGSPDPDGVDAVVVGR